MREALQRRRLLRSAARERLATPGIQPGCRGGLDRRPLHVCQGEALLLQPCI